MPDRAPRRRQPGPRSRRGAPPVGQTSGTRWAAASVLTVALVASPAASTSVSRSSETSESDVVRGRSGGFGVVPPEAWSEATDRAGTVEGLDLVLLSSRKVAGFSTNLVVLTSAGDDASVDAEI